MTVCYTHSEYINVPLTSPSFLMVTPVSSALNLTYVNVILGLSLPDVRPFYISAIDHCIATNNCADSCYLPVENAGHTDGRKKVRSLQNEGRE